jgi:hypothetical protein
MTEKKAIEVLNGTPLMRHERIYEKMIGKRSELGTALSMAIEALEKKIPKKPYDIIEEREETDFCYLAFMCPSCDEAVVGQLYRPNYCKHCGQRLLWEK